MHYENSHTTCYRSQRSGEWKDCRRNREGIHDTCWRGNADTQEDAEWLARKVASLRVFDDEAGVMNRDIRQTEGSVLAISQFTLFASYKKNNRPSWFRASKQAYSEPLYNYFCDQLELQLGAGKVARGIFGADMKVALINDGPVTIIMDTKNKE